METRMPTPTKFSFFVDRGGTFTDCLVLVHRTDDADDDEEEEFTVKVLSVSPDYGNAAVECIRRGLSRYYPKFLDRRRKIPARLVREVRIGTTIATNALLERKGERFALLVTAGFRDVLRIGNQSRPDIFALNIQKPSLLYETVMEIEERVLPYRDYDEAWISSSSTTTSRNDRKEIFTSTSGERFVVLNPLPKNELRNRLASLFAKGYRNLAISFLHASEFPRHEEEAGAMAREMGFSFVATSHETSRMVRVVPRSHTVCASTYLTPKLRDFVDSVMGEFQPQENSDKPTAPKMKVLFMKSDGGLESAQTFSGVKAVLSGPAGGVVGSSRTSSQPSVVSSSNGTSSRPALRPLIGFDMGGTSTDVSRFDAITGEYDFVFESVTAGVTIQSPQLDVSTVAAGGGSICRFRNGLFHVGPDSSGSLPGPICYGREGGRLSITDANAVLGRLVPSEFPFPLDVGKARVAFEKMRERHADELGGKSVEEIALGFIQVADEAMCRPIREMTLMRGHDVAGHVLCSFGGAGGQHAASIARALGISTVRISRYAGVLSAVGIAMSEIVEEASEPSTEVLDEGEFDNLDVRQRIETRFTALEKSATEKLLLSSRDGEITTTTCDRFLMLRYRGTESTIPVRVSSSFSTTSTREFLTSTRAAFEEAHKRQFGFLFDRTRDVLADDIRVRVRLPPAHRARHPPASSSPLEMASPARDAKIKAHACVLASGERVRVPVYEAHNVKGKRVMGPCIIIQSSGSTVFVDAYANAAIAAVTGDIELYLTSGTASTTAFPLILNTSPSSPPLAPDPVSLSLFSHRFMSVAEQMGRSLRRTAVSVNIKERLDFSCALFSPDGGLVCHAPYIPVHLGSMSAAVRAQIALNPRESIRPGDVFMSNHPQLAGGSHLPDITVIEPAFDEGGREIVFWVASRAHHADIGGITPGSMPPHSKLLKEEGFAVVSFRLVEGGMFKEREARKIMRESRNVEDNLSDLRAQIAANQTGCKLIRAMVAEFSLPVVQAYMRFIQDNCARAVRGLLHSSVERRRRGSENTSETETGPVVFASRDYMDDGSEICLKVSVEGRTAEETHALFDFSETSPEVVGNWNCPPSVVMSAIVYCLRCLVEEPIPLNEGCLAPVTVRIPPHSLLSPSPAAAVVGGNVLTSQRLCDVIFKAFGAVADSQGCMNNLTLGDDSFGYYETICGGSGAGPGFQGCDAVHTHMTNTRIGDAEVIEKRYPLMVRRFAVRQGSGGAGKWRGGCGVLRELLLRRPLVVSLTSERRALQPNGIAGGGNGARGINSVIVEGGRRRRNFGAKNSMSLSTGDVVMIETPGGGGYGSKKEGDDSERTVSKL